MKVEIRNNSAVVEGYVNAVERDSRPIRTIQGQFTERVQAGTFRKALATGKPVELRYNHKQVLTDTTQGLELHEDNIGLHAKATITDANVISKLENGEVRGWSFGFKDNNVTIADEKRVLNDITLTEVSLLDITPAYVATSVEMRSEDLLETRGLEDTAEVTLKKEIDYTKYIDEIKQLGGK